MAISVERMNDTAQINITDTLNVSNYQEVLSVFTRLLEEKVKHFIVDLEKVHYIDSSGFGILINCYKETENNDATFKIVNVNEEISKIFCLTQLNRFFNIA